MRNWLQRDFAKLLDLLYAAALDQEQWQPFLDQLHQSFDGATGVFHIADPPYAEPRLLSFGSDPALLAQYASYYGGINPYPQNAFLKVPLGEIGFASDALPEAVACRTEFYNDWMKPQGATTDHMGVILMNEGPSTAMFAMCPHASVYRHKKAQHVEQLRLLLPHLMRAMAISRATSAARLTASIAETALDTLGVAVFVLDRHGHLVQFSTKAHGMLRDGSVISVDAASTLRATASPGDEARLAKAVGQALSDNPRGAIGPLRLTSRLDGSRHVAWVIAASPELKVLGQPSAAPTAGHVLVLIQSAATGDEALTATLGAVYGLTRAEARLAGALIAGSSLAAYAADRGLSAHTVRNQLRSIFAKTGTRRQAELVALLARASHKL